MKLTDVIKFNLQRFKTRKMRVLLTILGVGVGISIVYFLVSLAFGVQELVVNSIVTSESLLALDVSVGAGASDLLSMDESFIDRLLENPMVEKVSAQRNLKALASYSGLDGQSLAYAVPPDFFSLAGVETLKGELFDDPQAREIVVTASFLRLFNLELDSAVGKELNLSLIYPVGTVVNGSNGTNGDNGTVPDEGADMEVAEIPVESVDLRTKSFTEPFKIVGVLDSSGNYFYIPNERVPSYEKIEPTMLKVKAVDRENIDILKEQILGMGYSVNALTDTIRQLNQIFSVTQVMFTAVGVVALFISAVGMFNTMTISLLERTREIGIMKAIGAKNRDIWKLFLFDSIIVGFLGGLSGLILGMISTEIVNMLVNQLAQQFGGQAVDLFSAPVWFVSMIIGSSFIIGLMTGFYPARRAARLNPLDALRYE